jgi:hypothetical protein
MKFRREDRWLGADFSDDIHAEKYPQKIKLARLSWPHYLPVHVNIFHVLVTVVNLDGLC